MYNHSGVDLTNPTDPGLPIICRASGAGEAQRLNTPQSASTCLIFPQFDRLSTTLTSLGSSSTVLGNGSQTETYIRLCEYPEVLLEKSETKFNQ